MLDSAEGVAGRITVRRPRRRAVDHATACRRKLAGRLEVSATCCLPVPPREIGAAIRASRAGRRKTGVPGPTHRKNSHRAVISARFGPKRARLGHLPSRLNDLSVRLDDLSTRLDRSIARLDDLTLRLVEAAVRLSHSTVRLDALTVRLGGPTARLEGLAVRLDEPTVGLKDSPARSDHGKWAIRQGAETVALHLLPFMFW